MLIAGGCVPAAREHLFSGRAVAPIAAKAPASADHPQSGEEIAVQGWVASGVRGRSLQLTFSNQSAAAIPLSAVVDEYTANTSDGRVFELRDVDFLNYPDHLGPGDERTVTVFLPKGLAAQEITRVTAKLNQGRVVIVLQAIGPTEPPAWRVGAPTGLLVREHASMVRMDAGQTLPARAPAVLEPVGPVAPRSEAPPGTIPIIVEFRQSLGSALRAEIFWNASQEHVTLASGDRQLFYVVPGQHEFHAISRLPLIVETHARVPVVVTATAPIRIDLSADARLTGVELRVQVRSGDRLVANQLFSPLSKR